jgi:hypothetical protein
MIIGTPRSTRQAQVGQVDQRDERHPSKIDKNGSATTPSRNRAVFDEDTQLISTAPFSLEPLRKVWAVKGWRRLNRVRSQLR